MERFILAYVLTLIYMFIAALIFTFTIWAGKRNRVVGILAFIVCTAFLTFLEACQ